MSEFPGVEKSMMVCGRTRTRGMCASGLSTRSSTCCAAGWKTPTLRPSRGAAQSALIIFAMTLDETIKQHQSLVFLSAMYILVVRIVPRQHFADF